PYCRFDVADDLAAAWGAVFVDAGDAGHINAESGHGPWPEGLTRFATLLSRV
ncbi:MAG TPA: alpha/beta hydrolase, partial [Methylomirabilota bacterium]|nr:alpha/beta hydrolase [Methylomirabilota bacterium]